MPNKFVCVNDKMYTVVDTRIIYEREALDLKEVMGSGTTSVYAEGVKFLEPIKTTLCPKGYITKFEGMYLFTSYEKVLVHSQVPPEVVRGWLEYHSGEIV